MSEEERIKAIEHRQDNLEKSISMLIAQQSNLDKSVTTLVAEMHSHFNENGHIEKTIEDIHNSIISLTVSMASSPMERHRETQKMIDPIWDTIRKHDKAFHECGEKLKQDMRKEAKSHITLLWFTLSVAVILGGYIYKTEKEEFEKDIRSNSIDINALNNQILTKYIRITGES